MLQTIEQTEVTSETLSGAIDSETWRRIDDRLDDRGCNDNDGWLDTWADGHIEQYKMLDNSMRKAWQVSVPRATDTQVSLAVGEYFSYLNVARPRMHNIGAEADIIGPMDRPAWILSELESAINLGKGADYIAQHFKPKSVKCVFDRAIAHAERAASAAYVNLWRERYATLSSRFNTIKQTRDNTRRVTDYTLVCSIKPMAYLGLGHFACDNDQRSCFRVGGEYGHSPVIIGAGSDSVVWFLRDADDSETLARAWGSYTANGGTVQNVYADGVDKGTIVRAIETALGVSALPQRVHLPSGIYDNADCMSWGGSVPIGTHGVGLVDIGNAVCEDCGDRFNSEEEGLHVDGHGDICRCCAGSYAWSEYSEEYIHEDEAVYVEESDTVIRHDHSDLYQSIEGTYFIAG